MSAKALSLLLSPQGGDFGHSRYTAPPRQSIATAITSTVRTAGVSFHMTRRSQSTIPFHRFRWTGSTSKLSSKHSGDLSPLFGTLG